MKITDCVPQKMSKGIISAFLLALGLVLAFAGVTVLPIVGLVLAAPFILLAVYFYRLHLNDQCEIDPQKL